MKKFLKAISIFLVLALSFAALSCRNQPLSNYKFRTLTNSDAVNSWAELFDIFWHRMNTNYVFFDVYNAKGGDWDAIYDEYYPRFAELGAIYDPFDGTAQRSTIRAEQAEDAYRLFYDIVKDLEDGHYGLELWVQYTASSVTGEDGVARTTYTPVRKYFTPSDYRFAKTTIEQSKLVIEDEETAIYNVLMGNGKSPELAQANSDRHAETVKNAIFYSDANKDESGNRTVIYAEKDGSITWNREGNTYVVTDATSGAEMTYFCYTAESDSLNGVLGIIPVDSTVESAGNIVYFGFDGFSFSNYLRSATEEIVNSFRRAVTDKNTKGVIIDLRGNYGGYINDLSYLWSIFSNGEDVKVGEFRRKAGDARTNYGPWTDYVVYYTPTEHFGSFNTETPIAVLTNNDSVSCAEMSTLFFAALRDTYGYNVKIIGEHGMGGFGTLLSSGAESELYYNGGIVDNAAQVTQIFTPYQELRYIDGVNYEGKGFPADEGYEVPVNATEFQTGTDAKLEKALEWVREQNR